MPLPKTPPRASRKNRLPISLHPTLDHKLLGYAAAAGAAGVGILALAKPSQAEIVYTPTHQTVPPSLALDLNNDGITDFTISNYSWSCPSGVCRFQQLVVYPTGRNRVLATSAAGAYAQALQADKRVGPGPNFRSSAKMDFCKASRQSYYIYGPWRFAKNLYLGVEFSIDGKVHYGWARLSVTIKGVHCAANALLTGYAYETVPGKPILTGKTSGADEVSAVKRPQATLGALAQGSAGLVAWRRDEDADPGD